MVQLLCLREASRHLLPGRFEPTEVTLVAVALTPAKANFTLADGHTADIEMQAGQAFLIDGQEHTVENVGDSEFRVILVGLK